MTSEEERAYRWLREFPYRKYVWYVAVAMPVSIFSIVAYVLLVPARMEVAFNRIFPDEVASDLMGGWMLGIYALGSLALFFIIEMAVTLLRILRAVKVLVRVIDSEKSQVA
jgi:hypothetical protein